jgi:hypothetical protein
VKRKLISVSFVDEYILKQENKSQLKYNNLSFIAGKLFILFFSQFNDLILFKNGKLFNKLLEQSIWVKLLKDGNSVS